MTSHNLASPADSARLKTSQHSARLVPRPARPPQPQGRGPTPQSRLQDHQLRRVTSLNLHLSGELCPALSLRPAPSPFHPEMQNCRPFHEIASKTPRNSTNCTKFHIKKFHAKSPRPRHSNSRRIHPLRLGHSFVICALVLGHSTKNPCNSTYSTKFHIKKSGGCQPPASLSHRFQDFAWGG